MVQERDLATIEADINATKEALKNVKGSETEVYARIVGYYRSVRNWNKGKRDEYNHRKQFVYENDETYTPTTTTTDFTCESKNETTYQISTTEMKGLPVSYEFFARTTCPNCPPVKEYLANCSLTGNYINVDTEDGLNQAAIKGVFAAPTVIIYDSTGTEISRAHNTKELANILEPVAVCC